MTWSGLRRNWVPVTAVGSILGLYSLLLLAFWRRGAAEHREYLALIRTGVIVSAVKVA